QERPVALDALPGSLHPLGVVLLEVSGRVDDRSREADQIDLSLGEPALLAELAHELVAIELLDRVHEAALVDPLDVDHLRLDAPLDRVGQGLDRLDRISAVRVEVRGDRNGGAEGHEDAPTEGFPRIEVRSEEHTSE